MQRLIRSILPLSLFSAAIPALIDASIKGVALCVVLAFSVWLIRQRSAAVKHAVWFAGMTGLLILPVASVLLPALQVLPEWYPTADMRHQQDFVETGKGGWTNLTRVEDGADSLITFDRIDSDSIYENQLLIQSAESTPHEIIVSQIDEPYTLIQAASVSTDLTITAPSSSSNNNWPAAIVAIWCLGVCWQIGRLALGQIGLSLLFRKAVALNESEWRNRIENLCKELKLQLRWPVTVWQVDSRLMPLACGVFSPRIVLPNNIDQWSDERMRAVLLHELAHIKRRDCLTQWIAEFARALHWVNPLVWLAIRQLRSERERACDDLVLELGVDQAAYAEQLVQMTSEYPRSRSSLPLAVAMARSAGLQHRVERVLDASTKREQLTWRGVIGLVAVAVLILAPLSMLQRQAAGDGEISRPKATQLANQSKDKTPATSDDIKLKYEVKPLHDKHEIEVGGRVIVEAKLSNLDKKAVSVYWGDYALPSMYQFDIRHDGTKRRIPNVRNPMWRSDIRSTASVGYFRRIKPGESVTYNVYLGPSPGANAQRVHFQRPGTYTVTPTLHVTTGKAVDRKTGETVKLADVWTGKVEARPFAIRVLDNKQPGVTVSGKVVNEEGAPVANATVQIQHRVSSFGSYDGFVEPIINQAYTDEQGRFECVNLPKNSSLYRITAWAATHPVGSKQLINSGKLKYNNVEVRLFRGVLIKGQIVDREGQPLSDVRVAEQTYTNALGRFSFIAEGKAKEYYLHLWKRGFVSVSPKVDAKAATSGSWKYTLLPEKFSKVKGRVQFVGGKAVPLAKLEFDLFPHGEKRTPQNNRRPSCETKVNGEFELTLPEPRAYTGIVRLYQPLKGRNGKVWKVGVERISGNEPLNLTFDNRGTANVEVVYAKPLPKSLHLRIQCQLDDRHIMGEKTGGGGITEAEFKSLGPGKYTVKATIAKSSRFTWSKTFTIPIDAPTSTANVKLEIPELRFGSLRAKVVMPDGKTPARNARLRIDSFNGISTVKTDEDGNLKIDTWPVGRVSMSPRDIEGIAPETLLGKVVANETTDLGTIRLKRIEELYGWVEGTLKYDDGTPAIGATTNGVGVGVSTMTTMHPNGFDSSGTVGQDGKYRVRLPASQHYLAFDLLNAAGWQLQDKHVALRRFREFTPDTPFERLELKVDIEAAKTLKRDIILKRPKRKRPLKVAWNVPNVEQVYLSAIVDAGSYRLLKTVSEYQQDVAETEFQYVPEGKCTIAFFSASPAYFALVPVDMTRPAPTVKFDIANSSTIAVRVIDENGKSLRGLGLSVMSQFGSHRTGVCVVKPATADDGEQQRSNWFFTEHKNGLMKVGQLAAGKYEIAVTNGDWKIERTIDLKSDFNSAIEWTIDSTGKVVKTSETSRQ